MPRYATKRFQLGDYWLSRQKRSPAWCRTWYCNNTRQTRRVSLLTADTQEAQNRLTEWFILEYQQKDQPTTDVTIASIFARYFDKYGQNLKSFKDVQRNLNFWLEFHGDATLAEAADMRRQEAFREWMQKDKNLSLSSIRKTLIIGKAAFNWAYRRGEIAQVPYFELVKPPTPEPMGRHLEIPEVAKLLSSTSHQHIKMFLLMLAGTAARPQAVLELKYEQIDFERNIIDLNPKGRTQTQKTRAVVKLPQSLKRLLLVQRDLNLSDYVVQFNGEKVKSTKTAWGRLRDEAGLDAKVLPYSIRRTMARFLRMQGVPAWEVAEQLGHRSTGYRITELYTAHSPDYLEKSVAAIDVFFEQVACEMRVNDLHEILVN